MRMVRIVVMYPLVLEDEAGDEVVDQVVVS